MANKMPSLLGLLAVAGYQNRDKISDALKGLKNDNPSNPTGSGGLLGGIGDLIGAAAGGGGLTAGLSDLLNNFKNAGQGDVADSWVTPGVPTQGLTPDQVEKAVGAENLAELATRTGLTREELLQRLSKAIPENVDRLTPDGKMPTEEDAVQHFGGTA